MTWQVRPVEAAERPALAGIRARALDEWKRMRLPAAGTPPDADQRSWVAEEDGALGGIVTVGPAWGSGERKGSGQLHEHYVVPERRDRSIGVLLFCHASRELALEGFDELSVLVPAGAVGVRGFYETAQMVVDEPPADGPSAALVRFRRRLPPAGDPGSGGREPVLIHAYDPSWPRSFEAERREIGTLLPHLALEHVGSTSVPGLAAKPIVDIQAGAAGFDDAIDCIEPLQSLGWQYRGEMVNPGALYFRRFSGGIRTHQLHLCIKGGRAWTRRILFRDHLRARPEVCRRYEELKRRLAGEHGDDRIGYNHAKTEFIRSAVETAEEELPSRGGAPHPLAPSPAVRERGKFEGEGGLRPGPVDGARNREARP